MPYYLLISPLALPIYDASDRRALGGYVNDDSTMCLIECRGGVYLARPEERDFAVKVLDWNFSERERLFLWEGDGDRLVVPPALWNGWDGPAPSPRDCIEALRESIDREMMGRIT